MMAGLGMSACSVCVRGVGVLALLAAAPAVARGQAATSARPDTSSAIKFGGFVDGYYAYDFDRPPTLDRAFTTQPARDDEFNINLAYVDAALSGAKVRGRIAVQYGTSVQSNYAAEPHLGAVSGPSVSQYIQEAFAGYRAAPSLWLDAGIFFSHIGNEGWISRDQWTYSRSLIADYSPYYEAGVRAVWTPAPALTATAVLVNGWQNISETNSDKAIGVRLDYAATSRITLTYDNFIGNERPDSLPSEMRVFQEVIAKFTPTARLGIVGSFDYGTQAHHTAAGSSDWMGGAVVARYGVTPAVVVNARLEFYRDPDQVLVASPSPNGFRASGISAGVDVVPAASLLWRVELRGLRASDAVFPDAGAPSGLSRSDGFVVSSLALTF